VLPIRNLKPNISSINRLVNYADPLFENGSLQSSEQLRIEPSEQMRLNTSARSPLSNIGSKFIPPLNFQDHHPAQIADPRVSFDYCVSTNYPGNERCSYLAID
jgi:hypothetical protein